MLISSELSHYKIEEYYVYCIFQLTTSILMRRVYCSTCPWTQWLLLASVGILHGQATPTLDSVSLHMLQGTLNDKLASSGDLLVDAEENAETHLSVEKVQVKRGSLEDVGVDLGSTFDKDRSFIEPSNTSQKSTVTGNKNTLEITLTPLKNNTLKTSHISPKKRYYSENEKSFKVASYPSKDCNFNAEKHNQKTCSVPPKEDKISVQDVLSLSKELDLKKDKNFLETSQAHHKNHCLHEDNIPSGSTLSYRSTGTSTLVHQQSISVQVTPKKLGFHVSKWVQFNGPRRIEVAVQTEPLPSYETVQLENLETQIYTGCLSKTFADKEAQTLIKAKRDASSQTGTVDLGAGDQSSQPVWKMISLSAVPKRKKHLAPGKKSKMKIDIGNDQEESNNIDKVLEDGSIESSTLKEKQHFHGNPLLKGKASMPVEIPLNSVMSLHDPVFQDPRLLSKSHSS